MLVYVLFYLGQLSHFPSCCGAGVRNLNEPPLSFLLPPRRCGLGAGSIPLRHRHIRHITLVERLKPLTATSEALKGPL